MLDDKHPNVVQGGRRPRATLSPTVVRRDRVEAPRFNSLPDHESFGARRFRMAGGFEIKVVVIGPFMMNTGTAPASVDQEHGTLFGAADGRRQRFVVGR